VQWGDTLSGIAALCGTTVAAIRAANPGLGWWLYAGQGLYIPTGYTPAPAPQPSYGGTYVVQRGDTLGKIAARVGCSVKSLLAVNPQIYNVDVIYVGQVINLPSGAKPPAPPPPPPCNCPPSPPSGSFSTLKVAYKGGLFIRTEPGGKIIASALNNDTLYYRTNSVFVDKKWKVWVEVKLFPPTKGYYVGWVLVRDQYGTYFVNPQIDP
jgi:LysM repeat protein